LKSLRLNLAGIIGPDPDIFFASDWKKGRGMGIRKGIWGEAVRGSTPLCAVPGVASLAERGSPSEAGTCTIEAA
jgi:hypothetical protein